MEEKKTKIPNVSCHHCAMTINRELSEIQGVQEVDVDVEEKMLIVRWQAPTTWDEINKTLSEIGYPPQE